VGYLYGYYSEDPNYPEGVRANVEAIYEPPQIGETNDVIALEDSKRFMVDMIAEALTLERIGWIFTSINQDFTLSPAEVRKIAKLQEEHIVDHPDGVKISK
jgi:nuclear protein localization family protein 4